MGESRIAKILVIFDIHIKAATPVNRLDNYFETTLEKLQYVVDVANNEDYDLVICTGDLFDSPVVSIKVLLETYKVFKKLRVPLYMPLGNHDIYGYNLGSYSRSSARLLSMLCNNLHFANQLSSKFFNGVEISLQPFCAEVDTNGYGYDFGYSEDSILKIHVVHGMLMKSKPNFEPYTLISDVKTAADIVISGHDHIGYGLVNRDDGKLFVNVGSLTRKTASVAEIKRIPKYCTLTCYSDGNYDIEVTDLPIAKSGEEVLNRDAIEDKKCKEEVVEDFKSLLKESVDFGTRVNLEALIISIAKLENVDSNIVSRALNLVEQAREEINLEEV